MNLTSIQSEAPHRIKTIEESDLTPRLYELGIYPNQVLKVIKKAPLGDPIVIEVEDQLVMLRLSEAQLITIEENK